MALSKLITITDPVVVNRDSLYFGKYKYSLCFTLHECGVLRERSEAGVLRAISWRNTTRLQWNSTVDRISEQRATDLLDMWNLLDQHKSEIKFVCSYHLVYLYGNDLDLMLNIACQSYTQLNCVHEAAVTLPKDVVVKRNPKFKFRSYFKETSLEQDKLALLRNFLTSRSDTYGMTNTFRLRLDRPRWFYLQRHQWIEHDNVADITMLSLVVPGLIRKTVPVQAK